MVRTFATQMNLTKFRKISKYLSNSTRIASDFFHFFECRIDLILYRLNFFTSSFQCRQIINHGFVTVNKIKVLNSSFIVKKFNFISFYDKKRAFKIIQARFRRFLIFSNIPFYILSNYRTMDFLYTSLPRHHKFLFLSFKNAKFNSNFKKEICFLLTSFL